MGAHHGASLPQLTKRQKGLKIHGCDRDRLP